MKKLLLLVIAVCAAVIFSSNVNAQTNDIHVQLGSYAPIATENDYPNAIFDLLRNHNVDSLLGTPVCYGVCWTGDYYVTSRFSTANRFNRMNSSWVKVDSFAASGAGTGFFRDLAYANGKIWGSPLSNTIYGINPNTGVMEKTIVTSGASIRALTWDPVRKGFWCGTNNFTGPLVCYDTNGVAIAGASITMPASGCYGVAYDDDPAGPFLWVTTDQTPTSTTGSAVIKFNATTLAQIGTPINFTVPLTSGAPLSSGGSEVTTSLIPGKRTLVGLVQGSPDRVYVLELGDAGAVVPTGTWTEQTSGLTTALYSVSAVDDNIAWIAGAGGKVLRTTNKGVTWTQTTSPSSTDNYTMYAFDANTAIVTASGTTTAYVYRTTNGGSNWTTVLTQTGGFFDDVQFKDANNGMLYGDPVGGRWTIFRTSNGGVTWDSTGMNVTTTAAGWNNGMYLSGNTVYLGTNNGTLVYSTNFGTSWTIQTTLQANTYVTWFNSPTTGLTGGAELNLTTNGGTNWSALTSVGTGNISGITGASTSWWMSRQTTAVNYSSNNGTSWSAQYTAPAGNFYHLTKSRSGATIWGVRSNGGISRYGQPIIGINPISNTAPDNYLLSQNYPNPFNPVTKINFAIPKSGLVTIKIYDLLGKEVRTLVNETKNAGSYSVDFNGSELSSGIYFYKINVNNFTDIKKMTLIK